MVILPAIDIRGGNVVRLSQGDYDRQVTYSSDPAAVAAEFLRAGATWIHVVDLDAARSGRPANTDRLREVCRAAAGRASVQFGGGVRSTEAIADLLAAGAARLVIGSAALKNWEWFENLLADDAVDNGRLALGLDAREGRLAAEGWTEPSNRTAVDLARRVRGSGLGAIVHTDIARDGMLAGVNVAATAEILAATDVPVIASGGVSSLEDVRACRRIGCWGAIVGKAWYEGKLDLARAISEAQSPGPAPEKK